MEVAISNPSKRLFSFQFSDGVGRVAQNTGNICSLFLPLLRVCVSLDTKLAKRRHLKKKYGRASVQKANYNFSVPVVYLPVQFMPVIRTHRGQQNYEIGTKCKPRAQEVWSKCKANFSLLLTKHYAKKSYGGN